MLLSDSPPKAKRKQSDDNLIVRFPFCLLHISLKDFSVNVEKNTTMPFACVSHGESNGSIVDLSTWQ